MKGREEKCSSLLEVGPGTAPHKISQAKQQSSFTRSAICLIAECRTPALPSDWAMLNPPTKAPDTLDIPKSPKPAHISGSAWWKPSKLAH